MKEVSDDKGFEDEVKAAAALRKKAAVHHNDVGDDMPTADEVAAEAKAETAKKTFPSGEPTTAKEVKVVTKQKEFDESTPAAKEAKKMEE